MSIFSRVSQCVSAALVAMALCSAASQAQVNVTTNRYDNGRTGANLNETVLNTSNVTPTSFGKLYSYAVDGSVYAQPLYVQNVAIPGQGVHNVLYVATMNDVLYAFDADSAASNGGVLWKVDYKNPGAGVTSIPITDIVNSNSLNIVGTVGIESTPVIDLNTNTMYFVARTKEVVGATTSYVARLHAVDITTGAEKFGGPTVIQGQVNGNGNGSSGGVLKFDPFIQNQRSALALVNGFVVFSWASHEDFYAWHGWAMAYSASTLQQTGLICFSPNGLGNGSWMAGRGPAVDANGNVYYMTGNGDWDGTKNFGDSIVKLSTAGGALSVTDYFTPDNYAALQQADEDLGSGGPMLIPGTDYLIGGGKQSLLYLMHTGSMGHMQVGNGQIPQLLPSGNTGYFTGGGPTFWNRTTGAGPTMYIWTDKNTAFLTAFHWNGSTFDTAPLSQSTMAAASGFATGAALTLSANGSTVGTGIVWASMPTATAGHGTAPGLLRAFDANNLGVELWNSTLNSSRDNTGTWAKFVPPTVANGKVYAASFSNTVSVFGLLNSRDFSLSATPPTQTGLTPLTYTINVGSIGGFTDPVTLSFSSCPIPGTTVSGFNPPSPNAGSSSTVQVFPGIAATPPPGTYTCTVTGVSGTLSHTTTFQVVIPAAPDFSFTTPQSLTTVTPGGTASFVLNVGALNGFTGPVTITQTSVSGGILGTPNPSVINTSGSASLDMIVPANTPPGSYVSTFSASGTAGGTPTTHFLTLTVVVTNSTPPPATSMGIKFVGTGTAMGASETAGVVAKSHWNNATGTTNTTGLSLADENGSASGATVTWSGNSTWATPIADQAGNFRMMRGYLDASSSNTIVNVSGLSPNASGYTVYVYGDGDDPNGDRSALYQISGAGITTTSIKMIDAGQTNFSGTFTQANNSKGNYVVFTINATAFTLTAIPSTAADGFQRAPLNGIQIVPLGPATPDFSLTGTPSSASTQQGGNANYTVNAGALNGFSGNVALSVSGLPTGATASFNPTSIATGTSSALTVTTAATTPIGGYTLTITGTSGALTHTATVTLVVTGAPDFSIGASPSTATAVQGNNGVYTVTSTALNSFGGVVTLGVSGLPTGATASFNPTTITGGGNSTLTVTTTASTPVGIAALTITGVSGALNHTATVSLNVVAQGTITANTIGIKFVGTGTSMGASEAAGVIAKSNWNNAAGASSTNALGLQDETGSATTATVTWHSDNTWVVPGSSTAGNLHMMRGYLDTGSRNTSTVTVNGLPANPSGYNVYVYADGDNGSVSRAGVYQISGAGITTSSISLTDAANANFGGTFTQANNSNGNYVLFTINASGFTISAIPSTASDGNQRAPLNAIQIVPVGQPVPDFSIGANPSSNTATQGGSANYTVSATALNGFTGAVALTASGLPTGATASFNPTSINGGASSTLTITTTASTPVGSSTVTITGTSGAITHTAPVTLVVNGSPDFTVNATPATATATQGGNATYTASVAALSGFAGTVNLSASGLPTGATASFNPSSIAPGTNSILTITTAANTPTGSSTITITGVSGALTHTKTVTLTVTGPPDFTIAATPPGSTVSQGNNASYTTSVAAVAGFTGTVTLSASGLPTGATASFNPAAITSGNSSVLTVTTNASTPIGSSTITITGTSGTLTHSTPVTLSVTSVGTGGAKAISIDFIGNGIPMGPSETAGVVAKSHWNSFSGVSSATPLGLVDETGSATSAAVTWNANATWVLPITDQPGNVRMMEGYLDASNSNTIVNVSGLPGNVNGYTVYVYMDGDDPNGNRSGIYQISGAGITTTSITAIDAGMTNFSGTFTQANNTKGNYVVFTINASAFTITAIPSTAADGFQRAPLNAIQIIPR